ncbi:hypothetical protein JHK87_015205 [Glycine soja]|nr:hypothetical protein JHK87_015205 [Glycine soja]
MVGLCINRCGILRESYYQYPAITSYAALLKQLEVSCCRGNFSCFVILRACHHVLYDPSFQAVLGFPFVVCFTDSDYKLKIAGKQPLRFQDKAAYSYPLRIPAGWKPCPLNWSC